MKQLAPNQLRLGLVGPLPPPSGGMANQTRQLARLLTEEGVAVEVVRVNADYRPAWIERIKGLRAFFRLFFYLISLWRAAGRVDLFHIMANSGWAWHLFAAPAIWIAHLRGVPVVLNYRGGEADTFFRRAFHWVRPSLKRCSVVVVPSGFLEKVFADRGVGSKIVPNIIDLDKFSSRPDQSQAEAVTLFVARNLEPIYGIDTLIRAHARVKERYPQARLVIAGSGPQKAELEDLARELGTAEAVEFTGRIDNDEMARRYWQARVAVNPSRVDNMPISVLEALACEVPVVSTAVGGVPYMVADGETALLVPADEPEAMAGAILRLLDDSDLAGQLKKNGKKSVEQYTWPRVRERLFAVYGRALNRDLKGEPVSESQ